MSLFLSRSTPMPLGRSSVLPAFMLAALALMMCGCQGLQHPTAEVTRVAVTDQTDAGARVEVTVRLNNPNDVALPVKDVDYRITVDGAGAFDLTDHPAATLPPNGTQTLVLPAAFRNGQHNWAGRGFRARGTVSYQPPGQLRELLSQYDVPLPTVLFDATGRLGADAPTSHAAQSDSGSPANESEQKNEPREPN